MRVKCEFSTPYAVNLNQEERIIQMESVEKLRSVRSTYCTQWESQRVRGGEQRLSGEYLHGTKLSPFVKSNSGAQMRPL